MIPFTMRTTMQIYIKFTFADTTDIQIGNKKVKTNLQIKDRPLKSILKAFSWRIVGTLDTILISWILSGKIAIALSIGGVEIFSKITLYYLHERLWNSLKWGRMSVKIRKKARFLGKSFFFKINKKNVPLIYSKKI
ncbi:MAG TPA: DUF2061 domain-containing protein [Bacteroidales bacterium]|nr:DUF2061 domain-containing protein [Bacteroidales bacterium]HQI46177.1 DUF2061 domain-containing protein [Bacteroidales bacterium]